jgi:iron complex outermembrane receptor protein
MAIWGAWSAQAQNADGEIIVVAQRRAENIQNVPISVSAVSADRVTEILAGGGDALALAGRIPGLNVESSNGGVAPRFYIRGLGNTDFDLAASQPVSVIMDDVVMENVSLKSFPLFDVAQVEVSRGPQGTLFGRNTPAGIVQIITRRPSDEFEAMGSASYGTFGTSELQAAIGGAIGAGLSGRVSILAQHRDDWVSNGFTGQSDALGGYDELAGRVQLMFMPSDNFSALLNVHGRSNEGTSTLFRANIFTTGSNELNGNFDRDTVWYDLGRGNPQEYDSYGAALTLTWDLGGATLTSISAYENSSGRSLGDIDGGACAPLAAPVPAGLTSGATDCFIPV